ncbi:MAG: MBL fold metallo-hydrolase [Planctomycetota bacterium]
MQVTGPIHALRIPFQVPIAPGKVLDRFVYTFLVVGDRITLIDSGVAGAEQVILDYIHGLGREARDTALLVLTHSHPDHVGAARGVKAATGCAVAAHGAEQAWSRTPTGRTASGPCPGSPHWWAGR